MTEQGPSHDPRAIERARKEREAQIFTRRYERRLRNNKKAFTLAEGTYALFTAVGIYADVALPQIPRIGSTIFVAASAVLTVAFDMYRNTAKKEEKEYQKIRNGIA